MKESEEAAAGHAGELAGLRAACAADVAGAAAEREEARYRYHGRLQWSRAFSDAQFLKLQARFCS